MINITTTQLASESLGVATAFYNAFEVPINLIFAAIVISITISLIFKTFITD